MTDNSAETLGSSEVSGKEATDESVFALKASAQVSRPRLLELRQRVPLESATDDNPQQQLPFAIVRGEELIEVPVDLYIPPEALEVFLDAFEGPLDLLLYLIKKQNLDILDINVAELTEQYMRYVRLMDTMQFERMIIESVIHE